MESKRIDKRHVHEVVRESETRGYTRSVGTAKTGQDPRASGGITVTQYCACGATRLQNRNGGGRYTEESEWAEDEAFANELAEKLRALGFEVTRGTRPETPNAKDGGK